jgi:hypothetical protein
MKISGTDLAFINVKKDLIIDALEGQKIKLQEVIEQQQEQLKEQGETIEQLLAAQKDTELGVDGGRD